MPIAEGPRLQPGGLRLRTRRKQGEAGCGNPEDWEYYIIEVNPNSYLDQKTAFAVAARKSGLSYPEMAEKIIELAMRRRNPTEKLQTFRENPG